MQLALHLPSHAPTLGCDHAEEAPFSYLHKDPGGLAEALSLPTNSVVPQLLCCSHNPVPSKDFSL